jgi:hypothetical protein
MELNDLALTLLRNKEIIYVLPSTNLTYLIVTKANVNQKGFHPNSWQPPPPPVP